MIDTEGSTPATSGLAGRAFWAFTKGALAFVISFILATLGFSAMTRTTGEPGAMDRFAVLWGPLLLASYAAGYGVGFSFKPMERRIAPSALAALCVFVAVTAGAMVRTTILRTLSRYPRWAELKIDELRASGFVACLLIAGATAFVVGSGIKCSRKGGASSNALPE